MNSKLKYPWLELSNQNESLEDLGTLVCSTSSGDQNESYEGLGTLGCSTASGDVENT